MTDADESRPPLGGRVVTEAEGAEVTDLLASAFLEDPTWSWGFPAPEHRLDQLRQFWGLLLHSAIPYRSVYLSDDGGAAAVWIPPGLPELTDDDERRIEPLLRKLVGDRTDEVIELLETFDAHHPHDVPHYYLSILGTHPDHRGQGKGMRLLAQHLEVLDGIGVPSYLESSNRANDHRYERLGFRQIDEFAVPGGQPTLACMWRDPQ